MAAHPRRPDLHCHSYVSDGTHAPAWLAQRAHSRGVDLWALTDHDEVSGVAEAAATARTLGLPFLTGVEISVTWEEKTIHIVGLGVDENHEGLRQGLQQTRAGRVQRGQAMAAQLEALGIQGVWKGALKYVSNPELVARPHLARYLVEAGVRRSVGEVFLHYLKEGKPGFVPHQWANLPDALGWIHAAGGMAVVAHPARYAFSQQQEQAFFDAFVALGGQAVEVVTAAHTPVETAHFSALALKRNLYASCGSDFHDPKENRCDLGDLSPLPEEVTPVWQPLAPRIRRP
jgi:predicted metal-dependent phosphoesterase TrpH